ncbi:hypothetical protein KKB58_01840, partial [Patescibacteria group bacterium]|nr:hypothetical protein [Patescibacteria group bacterium]
NWIQTGNSGGPLFVQDPGKFFKDIAREELLGFGLEIGDSAKFPFGKAFMINAATNFNKKFAGNAQYSLDRMIQQTTPEFTAVAFGEDFSMGGWNAWDALIQNPANNPLGFQIEASKELAKRTAGTSNSLADYTKDMLQQSGGFLSDWRCVEPADVTAQENWAAINGEEGARRCIRGEYVTPGKIIGEKLTAAVGYNDHALLDAETLNDAIAAILDAVMARFYSELTSKGLAAINTADYDPYTTNDVNMGEYFSSNTGVNQVAIDFSNSYTTPWLSSNPSFNIRTDVTQALVDEQRTYLDKLDSLNTALVDLIKWIRQLDYCIPGPNPNWEKTTLSAIENIGDPSLGISKWWASGTATQIASMLTLGGSDIALGAISSKHAKKAAAEYIEKVLDVNISRSQDQITDQEGINSLFRSIYQSYRNLINKIYFTFSDESANYMPGVTTEARAEFRKIEGYQKMIEDNIEETTFRKSIITRLISLKQKIDTMTQTEKDALTSSSPIVTEFGRLSAYFVSGDDIAKVDNLYKEALDEKNYVKGDLLEGEFGCEKEIFNLWKNDLATFKKYARRQAYPYPIDHFYAWYGWDNPGGSGPYNVPYNAGDAKKMSTPTQFGGTDPNNGFLFGAVYYNSHAGPWNLGTSYLPCAEYIGVVSLSKKNAKKTGWLEGDDEEGDTTDIGGLNTSDSPANTCGVVTRGFEKIFNVY